MAAIVPFSTQPELFLNLCKHYEGQERAALCYKDKATNEWTDISWETLKTRVEAVAGYVYKTGVRKGDRVAILSENRPEWAIMDLASQLLGAVNVSIYTSLPPAEAAYILKDSGSRLLLVSTPLQLKKAEQIFDDCPDLKEVVTMSRMRKEHPDYVTPWDDMEDEGGIYWKAHAEELRTIAETITEDDIAALIYTSGTTGFPKGVMLTHRNFCSNARSSLSVIPFGPSDHHMSFLPLCHSFEHLAGYIAIMAAGAKITYAESIEAVSKNLPEVKPTVMISVPRLFERMYNIIQKGVQEGSPVKRAIFRWAVATGGKKIDRKSSGRLLDLQYRLANRLVFSKLHERLGGNIKFAVSGSAALPAEIGRFFQAAGVPIIEGYGLTETAPVLSANPVDAPVYGSVGHVIPGVTVAIQRLSDNVIVGEQRGDDYPSTLTTKEGEILAKGPNIMKGYWENEEATHQAIDAEGWYHTGDVGKFEDGYLKITDRIKHMIVSRGGKNIYPGPIEEKFVTEGVIEQIMVVGEGQPYLTALIVPNIDAVKKRMREQEIEIPDDAELLSSSAVQQLFSGIFKAYSKNAAPHEKIRRFKLIGDPFTIDNGLMTPTLKLKRKNITQRYDALIQEMYADMV